METMRKGLKFSLHCAIEISNGTSIQLLKQKKLKVWSIFMGVVWWVFPIGIARRKGPTSLFQLTEVGVPKADFD